ncbi:MAG TPA: asparagine synthase (glutamine-hydrolyzing) [Candidatus Polarisedimenticolia bacterium]|jgi:asparagine synthase (glutamine-hydrolysing)|nr:asparagine synthase (glutamine-hydrolyzing) [Candidatus Polarisedimenticolia bacterium]
MCGIFGIVGDPVPAGIDRACDAMRHRGPDDRGTYLDAGAGLGMTRLAILDLSRAGHQPMGTEDDSLWIVHNGEVYNFGEERRRLEAKGLRFRSHTDTEVILRLYEELGPACIDRLRGMFAFAVWDARNRRLFAARDRLGIKPLYYAWDSHRLVFASELKALLASGLVEGRLSMEGLALYLTFGYVPSPCTLIEGVQALQPGHHLTLEKGRLTVRRYWDLPTGSDRHASRSADEREAAAELRALLTESVRLRLISDVPIGAFLSGGIDSAAVVALMAEARSGPVKTFSIGFDADGKTLDETDDAGFLAKHLGTDHTRRIVTGREVADLVDRLGRALDQPSFDGINSYIVSQVARTGVTVALTGLGGDELFAGYPHFWRLHWEYRNGGWPHTIQRSIKTALAGAGTLIQPWFRGTPLDRYADWARVQHGFVTRYGLSHTLFPPAQQHALCTPGLAASAPIGRLASDYLGALDDPRAHDLIARVSRLDLKGYMAHRLLRDMDAMSMAHSLEVRVPLIDHRLVEFAYALPASYKYQPGSAAPPGGEREASYRQLGAKRILIDSVRDLLPVGYEDRPKTGFHLPMASWMKSDLRPAVDDLLSRESVRRRGLFRPEAVARLLAGFHGGAVPWHQVWALAALELWQRQVLYSGAAAPAGDQRATA